MTIRFQLIMLLVAAVLAVNSVLSLLGVGYLNSVWMREIQDRVRVSLNSVHAAYENHQQRDVQFFAGDFVGLFPGHGDGRAR